jgi:hypothetical protein
MKPIKELQNELKLNIKEGASHVKQLKRKSIDWDVYLPSIGQNLQRDFVWSLQQKRTLIESILIGRHIPHLSIINSHLPNSIEDHFILIDGKQRLSTIFDFIDDKFTIIVEGQEYLFSQLDEDYQLEITCKTIRYYVVDEEYKKPTSDQQKILWFERLNFGGTPQDEKHLSDLRQKITLL